MESQQLCNYSFLVSLLVLSICGQGGNCQDETNILYKDGDCRLVQAFQTGRNYYYSYDGKVEHLDASTNQTKTGFRAKCEAVRITVLSSCAARMKISRCSLYNGYMQDGRLAYDVASQKSAKFSHIMKRFLVYFYFNSGEITKVFFHQSEPGDVANIKRGILSAISLKFTGQGFQNRVDETFKIASGSIFGQGDSFASVTHKSSRGTSQNITTRRYLFDNQLSSTQYENSYLHMSGLHGDRPSDMLQFLAHQMRGAMSSSIGDTHPTQTCTYYVRRGRLVEVVTCSESHIMPIFVKMVNPQVYHQARSAMSTNVTIHLKLYRKSVLRSEDSMNSDEFTSFKNDYTNHTLMFRPQLDESTETLQSTFDPQAAFLRLVTGPDLEAAPLFAKLTLWISHQDEATINGLWYSIISSAPSTPQVMSKGIGYWIQLLNECMDHKWCQSSDDCSRLVGCQGAFSSLLSSSAMQSIDPSAQLVLLDMLSSIQNPSSSVVQAAQYLALQTPNPATILALGKSMNRYAQTRTMVKSEEAISEAQDVLLNIINQKCSLTAEDKNWEKTVVHAIKSLTPLLHTNENAMRDILTCIQHPSTTPVVSLAAIQAMNNEHLLLSAEIRRQLSALLADPDQHSDVRLASFLVIMLNDPNNQEIYSILEIANDENESAGIKYFMNEYIKSQLALTGTEYSSFSNRTVERITEAMTDSGFNMGRGSMGGGQIVKETTQHNFPLKLPFIQEPIDCLLKSSMYFSRKNPIPLMIKLSATAEVLDRNVSILDVSLDVGRLTSVLAPLLGQNGIVPLEAMKHLMDIPIYQWMEPFHADPPPMPEASLKNLNKIVDQFRLAQTVLDTQKKSALTLTVLGREFNLQSLTEFPFMQEMTMSKMFKLVEKLESGINFDETLLSMPAHFQSSMPTSLGIPLSTTAETTNFIKPSFSVSLDINKLVFTGRGSASLHIDPTIHMQISVERTIQLPRGLPCGSGFLLTITHDTDIRVEVKKSPNNVDVRIYPGANNELLSIRSNTLASPWSTSAGVEITSHVEDCYKSMINELYRVSLYTTDCGDPLVPHESGFWLDTDGQPFAAQLSWGFMPAMVEQTPVPSVGIELKVSKIMESSELALITSLSAKYLPASNEIQIMRTDGTNPTWMVNANLLVDSQLSTIENVFASFNVTANGMAILTSTLSVDKAAEDTTLGNVLAALNLQHVFNHGSSVGYDVRGTLALPMSGAQFVSIGHIPTPKPNGDYTAVAKLYAGPPNTPSLCTLVWEKEFVVESGDVGSKVVVVLKEMHLPFPFYKNMSLSMTRFNETHIGYRKVLRFESMLTDVFPGPFLDLRHTTVFSPQADESHYDWNATVTGNKFQAQWSTDSLDPKKLVIKSHLVIPNQPIDVKSVRPAPHEMIRLPVDGLDVVAYGVDMAWASGSEAHLNTTLFYTVQGFKQYVRITENPVNCDNCLAVEVVSPLAQGNFNFKIKPTMLQNTFKLTMPPATARYLGVPVPSYPTNIGPVEFGYVLDTNIESHGINLAFMNHYGNYICNTKGNLVWEPEIPEIARQSYEIHLNVSCGMGTANSISNLDFNIGAGSTYNLDKDGLDSTRMLDYMHYVQKGELMAFNESYGIYLDVAGNTMKTFNVFRHTVFSLAESETNEAVAEKLAANNITISYQEPDDNVWSTPPYHLVANGRIPWVKISPGGGQYHYDHTGRYFMGHPEGAESELDEVCQSMETCKQRYRNIMQANINDSLSTLLRLLEYIAYEHQQFINVPWNQLEKMMSSPSYNEISPYKVDLTFMKDAGQMLINAVYKTLESYDGNMELSLLKDMETEESLLRMQRYMEYLSSTSIKSQDYDITPMKIYVESLFRSIYVFDYMLGSMFENPLMFPGFVRSCGNMLMHQLSPANLLKPSNSHTVIGIFYPAFAQYTSLNGHYHIFPLVTNEDCDYLYSVDTKEGMLTTALKHRSSLTSANNETMVVLRNGSCLKTDENNDLVYTEFPFVSGYSFCSKVQDNEIECGNPFMLLKYIFDVPNDGAITFATIRGSFFDGMKGMSGVLGNDTEIPPRLIPDGSVADDESEFLNKYELTGDATCKYTPQDIIPILPTANGPRLCAQAFASYKSIPLERDMLDVLVTACTQKSNSMQDTCKYTNAFVHYLRQGGYSVLRRPECLDCGASQPVATTIDSVNLLIIVSRSSDMLPLNPKALLLNLVTEALQRLHDDGVTRVDVSLLTYGGPGQFYQASLNTMRNSISSSDLSDIEQAISRLQFNGPSYDSSSTAAALQYASTRLHIAYKGAARCAVIVAPESQYQNIAGHVAMNMGGVFAGQLTSVYMMSSMTNQECLAGYIMLPHQTSGGCYSQDQSSQLTQAMSNFAQMKLNREVSCTCNEVDGYTGTISAMCLLA